MKKSLLFALLLCLLATPCWANVIIPVFILFPVVIQSSLFGVSWKEIFHLIDYCGDVYCPDILIGNNSDCPSGYKVIECGFADYIHPVIFALFGLVLLWIVVQTEYLYLSKVLPNLNKKTLKKQIWKANAFSTAIGFLFWIPLALCPYKLTGYIFMGPLVLLDELFSYPTPTEAFILWSIAISCLIALLYVCFKLSHWTEAPFLRKIKGDYSEEQINKAVRSANRRSYWWLVLAVLFAPLGIIVVSVYLIVRTILNRRKSRALVEEIQKNK
ncbi:MAG: hypothetical protein J6Y03_00400 [Alphaproteobacteria bacterium]|nr:hypothetical protein [Alphaproteobacteria bacterium]